MSVQLLLNILIALLWVFLQDSFEITNFITGFIVGLSLIYIMRRFFPTEFYLKKVVSIIHLLYLFIMELILSSVLMIKQILRPSLNITPGIFSFETELEGDLEITVLALLLTLTPGSVVLEITKDNNTFYIHAMDIPESRDAVMKAKSTFEKAIMEVTR
ncbi:Na+/H+ antiporter subunit E [Alkalicoccobacillus murimartini]|uniref:Multicomponent Na+:H+ antiporter subunit E n=1 Tax=Alkalicoccobacillus murimartini TaxID=171685 RepID=A0ABT9YJ10_9BACI|nr:Na+/H+ antiporter subunit E [Alkalicoccobacillus murimartini]MDQ0207812.1 multicomponent Na+:H+ antiporter subunit E [Alkalicoccobacillus murimartini]